MNERSLRTLEFDKIRDMLSEKTLSAIGRELACAMEPSAREDTVRHMLGCTDEAMHILREKDRAPVDAFPDMRETLKRMRASLSLSPGELLRIGKCLRVSRMCKAALCTEGTETSQTKRLSKLAAGLLPLRSVEEEIARCIENEETLCDAASPQLAQIRRRMRAANEKVRERLNSMIRSTSYQKYLQEPIITIRSGRFVLPVKQEYRQHVPGLIHDQSGSGATLFIEPSAVVELGNAYKKLVLEEEAEIERVLIELTALVAPYAEDIYEDLYILGELDLIFAKARLSLSWDAVLPRLNRGGRLDIVRGRHPLLDPKSAVPLTLRMGAQERLLLITGPNTGGKTVALKTVGLFSLLAQSGLCIPAEEGSELPVYTHILADIGDEQSIEQSLSTFSSHMKNIVEILRLADADALLLFDELGAGTDPVEGAALAMSILEEVLERRSRCVATTHYSEVKAFALTKPGALNASMEFDIDRLCPTYRLIQGIPGKSNAFEISARLGLPHHLIERARGHVRGEDLRFEDVISGAQAQHRLAEEEKQKAQKARSELEKLRAETEREKRKLEEEKERLRRNAREEARRIVEETKAEMDALIARIHAIKDIDRSAADRLIQNARDGLRRKRDALHETERKPASGKEEGKPPAKLRPGQTVYIVSLEKEATVLSLPDAKSDVSVQVGVIKTTVKLADLREVREVKKRTGAAKVTLSQKTVGLELDVRGMVVDDAIIVVDRYLDDAAMAGLHEVNIIHGKGTGALRAGLQEHFRRHARVKSFRMGSYGEGDAGVTVLTLR